MRLGRYQSFQNDIHAIRERRAVLGYGPVHEAEVLQKEQPSLVVQTVQ